MARMRQLHEDYLPQCAKMCALIAAKKAEVQTALDNGTNVTADAQKKLTELGELARALSGADAPALHCRQPGHAAGRRPPLSC